MLVVAVVIMMTTTTAVMIILKNLRFIIHLEKNTTMGRYAFENCTYVRRCIYTFIVGFHTTDVL